MNDPVDKYAERLQDLQALLQERQLDALLVPHDDIYLSAELNPDSEELAFLTGFTGSAGMAAVKVPPANDEDEVTQVTLSDGTTQSLSAQAAIFVDGRYVIQVKEQTYPELFDTFNSAQLSACEYLCQTLPKGATVGLDIRRISYEQYRTIQRQLTQHDLKLQPLEESLVAAIWQDRPAHIYSPVEIYPDELNGCPSMVKRRNLAAQLRDLGMDATVICNPEAVCWLLNIRGRDRHCLPVVNCRLIAYTNEVLEWYIAPQQLSDEILPELTAHCGHVDIFPQESFNDALERLCTARSSVYIDPQQTNASILKRLYEGGAEVTTGLGLCELPKAIKNDTELAGEQAAHFKDGVAMCRFLSWLDSLTSLDLQADAQGVSQLLHDVSEASLATKAEEFRRAQGDFIECSFETISALGPNAAMCHYNYRTVAHPRLLGEDALYLIDSGAHYLQGTTDITRTVLCSPHPSAEHKKMYTLVLKCHIALASAIFPQGTSGLQLDALARRPLWDLGLDFDHGTGHGVGHLLAVHEGPQGISRRYSQTPLTPGMVLSIEPGFYAAGKYGIRPENLVTVTPCSLPQLEHMLCFSPLTLVPFDRRLIERDMLTCKEREWLNNYHQQVFSTLSVSSQLTELEVQWLAAATAAL